jgi:hypothetical protein
VLRFLVIALIAGCSATYAEVTNEDVVPLLVRVGPDNSEWRAEFFLLPGEHGAARLQLEGESALLVDVIVSDRVVHSASRGYLTSGGPSDQFECRGVARSSVRETMCSPDRMRAEAFLARLTR